MVAAQEPLTVAAFIVPTFVMLAIGLIYPAVLTIKQSFQNADSSTFVGLENYATLFREPEYQRVLVNTAIWVLLVPSPRQ